MFRALASGRSRTYCGRLAIRIDAARAQVLVEELTVRLIRNSRAGDLSREYCATDPCDPGSAKPDNIAKTAENYAAIDVSKIRLSMSNSEVDHFFEMARPGIARFEPKGGIDKHREFIANVLERVGFPLRQGIFEARNHNALVTRDHAQLLVDRVKSGTAGRREFARRGKVDCIGVPLAACFSTPERQRAD